MLNVQEDLIQKSRFAVSSKIPFSDEEVKNIKDMLRGIDIDHKKLIRDYENCNG